MNFLGELAGLGTSFCWSIGSTFFTVASRLIGSTAVNRIRLVLAMLLLMITHLIAFGTIVPVNASIQQWFWFGISGIVGFTIGDTLLFAGYVVIGNRLTMLMMSLAPIFGTILAWFLLHETLDLLEVLAIVITISGVVLVVSERRADEKMNRHHFNGILLSLGAAFCQALGLLASKKGLAGDFPALSGNLIRILVASLAIWLITVIQGKAVENIKKLMHKKAHLMIIGGAIFGPFIGVWLSLVAVQHTYIGIASALMALPPVILIPISHWVFKEKITLRTVLGTVIAVAGVALIFVS